MLKSKFGEPTFTPQTDAAYAYEWATKKQRIQVDYSTGQSFTISTENASKFEIEHYLTMVIFEKAAADKINLLQQQNYAKTKSYKVMEGDFKLLKHDPNTNILLADSLIAQKFKYLFIS